MRRIIIAVSMMIAASMLLVSCGGAAGNNAGSKPANAANTGTAPAADKAAVEGEIKKTIEDFFAALNKGDADGLAKFYSDDYTLIDQNGAVQTKAARIEAIKSGKVKMEGMKFADLKIKTNPSGDGAVATASVSGKTTFDGKAEERNSMVTWVLGKMKDKGWQFVNAQITDIKGEAPKADDKKPEAAPPANK